MATEALERGEVPIEDVKERQGEEAKISRSRQTPKGSEDRDRKSSQPSSAAMPAGSPKSLYPPSQPPVHPPVEFVQAEMQTPAPKETQVPRTLQDDGSGHRPQGSLEEPAREDVVSEVLRSASPNGPNVTPGPTPPVSVQTPLFTDEQVAQLLRLHNQAPWLYGGMSMGITPQVTRPAFLPTEEDVGSQFVRSRQFQERMEAEELRRNMEMVLEENKLLKGRLAQLESKVLDEPRFSTPESQKGVDEVQPPRKEAADPHLSGQPQKGFKEAETPAKAQEDGPRGQQGLKEAETPTKAQEDGPRGQQGFKEAETTTEAEDGPRGRQEKAYGTDPIAQKNMEFMVLMVETMRELQKKVQEGREDTGAVKGVEVIRHGGPDLPTLPVWNPLQGPLQLGPVVSDLTTTSEEWWQLMTKSTEEWYQQHMAMNPIQRLQHAATLSWMVKMMVASWPWEPLCKKSYGIVENLTMLAPTLTPNHTEIANMGNKLVPCSFVPTFSSCQKNGLPTAKSWWHETFQ